MTVFVCSLFLPKTIHFTLPGTPPRGVDPEHSRHKPSNSVPKPPTKKAVLVRQPSLFAAREDLTPPHTPTDDTDAPNLYSNEDGFRIQFPGAFSSTDAQELRSWGSRANQPMSRANSPPPALVEQSRTIQKARELGRQGVIQPKPLVRSESHDRVFASADWRVVSADQGNGGLRNAAEAAARDGKLGDYTWVGTLGMPTDALDGTQQKQDIEDTLANEHNMLTVFCSDKDFDGHYAHFCKHILWPVFHYQIPDNPKSKAYEDHSWKYYVNVNQAFADRIVRNWKRGDVVWIHD